MNPNRANARRRPQAKPCAESLEGRALLTGSAGDTFALLPVTIVGGLGAPAVPFTINPTTNFVLPRHKIALGIDVAPAKDSSVNPLIASVDNQHGVLIPQTFHSIRNPHLSHQAVARGVGTSAVITPITTWPSDPSKPIQATVNVASLNNTSGQALLGFYLPGDANGDGKVDQSDIQMIKQALGSKANQQKYNFDADANRDGIIGKIDLNYARQNMGVQVNVTPVVSANLDPASDTGAADRITSNADVHFSGTATPGAVLTYAEVTGKAPTVTTVADANGNYSLVFHLAPGVNTIKLTATDQFGQTISGQLTPVTLGPEPVVNTTTPLKPS